MENFIFLPQIIELKNKLVNSQADKSHLGNSNWQTGLQMSCASS